MTQSKLHRIAIAEGSDIIRKGMIAVLKQVLNNNHSFFEISTPEQLLESVKNIHPTILIINPLFFQTTESLKLKGSVEMKCIALQVQLTDKVSLLGYHGVISLYDEPQEIAKLFEEIKHPTEVAIETEPLSQREKEIIVCVVKGMTNKEIADKLFISVHTVITHRRNISRKLEIHSTAGLTIYAIINKLIDISDVSL